jgi:AcrR family transcriptional regulator
MAIGGAAGAPSAAARRPGAPTRRRGGILEAAVLEAAWQELTETGYAAFTMEGVAARARTSRAVLYRRWPNRPELVVAALRHHTKLTAADAPDTGTLRGDLLALLRNMSSGVGEVAGVLSFLIADYFTEAAPGGAAGTGHRGRLQDGDDADPGARHRTR